MARRFHRFLISRIFWCLSLLAIAIWASQPGYVIGWDLSVIRSAIVSLRAGHDPYADAIAAQQTYIAQRVFQPQLPVPFSYVYSPLTLPFLRLIGLVPFWLSGTLYWTVYVSALITTIWFGLRMVEPGETSAFRMMAPLAIFFPGLLQNDVLFSGNIAFLLYAAVFLSAVLGWRRGIWLPFYACVLVAACFKGPMLSLVMIAPLSARKQWIPAAATIATAAALFWLQTIIWPGVFANYLRTLDDMFQIARDFSSSPAGLSAEALFNHVAYRTTLLAAYLCYAIPIAVTLLLLSKRYFGGMFGSKAWLPVLLIGVLLLNPRIIEYDVAAITLPMALVAWRLLCRLGPFPRCAWTMGLTFAGVNVFVALLSLRVRETWKGTECVLLLGLFALGARDLFRRATDQPEATPPPLPAY